MSKFDELKDDVENVGRKGHKKETLIALGTLVLVVFAYLTWRSSKSGGTSTPAGSDTSGVTGDTGSGTDQSGIASANALGAGLSSVTAQLKGVNARLTSINKREAKTNTRLKSINKREKTENDRLKKLLAERHKKAAKHPGKHHPPHKSHHTPISSRDHRHHGK